MWFLTFRFHAAFPSASYLLLSFSPFSILSSGYPWAPHSILCECVSARTCAHMVFIRSPDGPWLPIVCPFPVAAEWLLRCFVVCPRVGASGAFSSFDLISLCVVAAYIGLRGRVRISTCEAAMWRCRSLALPIIADAAPGCYSSSIYTQMARMVLCANLDFACLFLISAPLEHFVHSLCLNSLASFSLRACWLTVLFCSRSCVQMSGAWVSSSLICTFFSLHSTQILTHISQQ